MSYYKLAELQLSEILQMLCITAGDCGSLCCFLMLLGQNLLPSVSFFIFFSNY